MASLFLISFHLIKYKGTHDLIINEMKEAMTLKGLENYLDRVTNHLSDWRLIVNSHHSLSYRLIPTVPKAQINERKKKQGNGKRAFSFAFL